MRKLRVGVWTLDEYSEEWGGGLSYYTRLINGLSNYTFKDAEIIFIGFNLKENLPSNKHSLKLPVAEKKYNAIWRFVRKFKIPILYKYILKDENELKKSVVQFKDELNKIIDIIYYLIPRCAIDDFPFIYTLWDLGHVSTYAFPEFTLNNEFNIRKQHYDLIPYKALKIFSESETGKEDIVKYLNINENRINVIPIFPSAVVSDSCQANQPALLTNEFFFIHYPAQYWAHKNHYNLLVSFKDILNEYQDLKLVFTGADKGNKKYVLQLIKQLELSKNVIDLGFVSIEELKWIYLNSQGLIMPSLLGPTNMPLLEAAELDCPVACSDLKGHKEQLGDYAYYFDPLNSSSITAAISKMINDNKNNVVKHYERKFSLENALKQIDKAFSELMHIRYCWGWGHD